MSVREARASRLHSASKTTRANTSLPYSLKCASSFQYISSKACPSSSSVRSSAGKILITFSSRKRSTPVSWRSRQTDPLESAVISVTRIHGGDTCNVIPDEVELSGTVRAFSAAVQDQLETGMRQMAEGIASAHGVRAEFDYDRRYCATVNDRQQSALMLRAMTATVGLEQVNADLPPTMGSEDFGWMLAACPGAYGVIGNGTAGPHGAGLHSPGYDFNDAIIPTGVAFWVNLVVEFFRDRRLTGVPG